MFKFLLLVAVLFALAVGFHWIKDTPGGVDVTVGDTAYAVDLTTAVALLAALVVASIVLAWIVRAVVRAPDRMARRVRRRNQERGRAAISQGLIAVAAGDLRTAERAVSEASRRAPDQPLARLLQAQAAQLKGDRAAARQIFRDMTTDPQTRIAGLRGLYVEAEREGEHEAARLIAESAREESATAPWAARALLRHQTAAADWDGALRTLSGAADARILDKRTARRQRAVLLTAMALDREDGDPDAARQAALEAHDLAPDLVPAAVVSGRLLSRQGDIRRATRVLEASWKAAPHPDLADAYLHVRPGDAASDRLKRAETLLRLRSQADEGRLAVARAAIDARDFARARQVLTPVLTSRPTRRALMLMADLEEADRGDRGRARGWLARAVHAPRDPAWTADGVILEAWAPASPVSGRIDAVEWKVPVTELEAPRLQIDAAEIEPPPTAPEPELAVALEPDRQPVAAAAADLPPAAVAASPEPLAGALPEEPMPMKSAPGRAAAASRPETKPGEVAGARPLPPLKVVPIDAAPEALPPDAAPQAPIPDDPGVGDDEAEAVQARRFRVF